MEDLFGTVREALAPLRVGVLVRDVAGSELLSVDADGAYPAASVIKVPLLMALYDDAAAGRIDLAERAPVGERLEGTGVLRDLRDVHDLTLRDLAALTIILSDNTATNALIARLGIGRVAQRLADWGCRTTALRRKMFDFDAAERGLENVASAREMAGLLARLVTGEGIARNAADDVLALMERCEDDRVLRRYLRPDATVPSKSGTLSRSRNDVALFRGPARTLICAAFAREVDDRLAAEHALGLLGRSVAVAAGMDVPQLPVWAAATSVRPREPR